MFLRESFVQKFLKQSSNVGAVNNHMLLQRAGSSVGGQKAPKSQIVDCLVNLAEYKATEIYTE